MWNNTNTPNRRKQNNYLLNTCVICICFCYSAASAQNAPRSANTQLPGKLADVASSYSKIVPTENIFLHTDRSYYSLPDTIWLKAYLLSGLTHTFSTISGLIYVELISDRNNVVKRISMPAEIGLSWSQLALDKNLPDGYYTLRAYTNWMQNAGTDKFFTKRIYISNPATNKWLVNQHSHLSTEGKKSFETIDVTLKDYNGKEYGTDDVTWTFKAGDLTLDKTTVKTNADGSFTAKLSLPDTSKVKGPFNLIINGKLPSQNAVIPVLGDIDGVDLQFMPEGGYLIAGLPTKIGFKAIGTNGLAKDIEGYIIDNKRKNIVSFKSAHKGMGVFNLTPEKGETYTAIVANKTFALPLVSTSGINLQVVNTLGSDSVKISINSSIDLLNNQPLLLAGFVNDVPYYETSIIASGQKKTVSLSKDLFPSGIVHFTVFNSLGQPISERATFVDHSDRLIISAMPSKTAYHTRDSVFLAISMKSKIGDPISAGSLSVAVTDDGLVKQDSLENNIVSSMLLTSGLKGTIEDPAYYFSDAPSATTDIDLLLLTQGWVSYNWPEILQPGAQTKFTPEKGLILSGAVTTMADKPVVGGHVLVMISGKKVSIMMDTVTDANGRFAFKKLPKTDSLSFYIQARNEKNKKARLQVKVDQFTPAGGIKKALPGMPWYVNTKDNTAVKLAEDKLEFLKKQFLFEGNNLLDEVNIGNKKGIRGSRNLNGPGGADEVIDQSRIEAAGEITLLDFLLKNVRGMNMLDNKEGRSYRIRDKTVQFEVDGWLSDRFLIDDGGGPSSRYDQLTTALNGIKMKDILGIEVLTSSKYTNAYALMNSLDLSDKNSRDGAYIEITTRGGKGLSSNVSSDATDYKPVPITWPKQFYRPRYTASSVITDLRPTIHWEPQLATSKAGKTGTSFYAADKPGIYTVIIQGADLRGLVGFKRLKLSIIK
ncbi:MAG: hypothetical protein JWQ34_1544 [Mucilaginibacter sp.]|nr:hypothetical protein [Mucilaginibacter sp.]